MKVLVFVLIVFSYLAATHAAKPNIIFFLTDDQDLMLGSLDFMPKLQKYMRDEGAFLPNYFIPTPLCCPSRASILRGQYAHNTDIISLTAPGGGAQKFRDNGKENSTMGLWLHNAGYATALMGKYLNGYPCDTPMAHNPPAYWDHWFALCDPHVYDYYNSSYSLNGKITPYPNEYQTDTLGTAALTFIENHANVPFFLYLSGVAPHQPATPAKKYANLFANLTAPRIPSYNAADKDKPSFFPTIGPLNASIVEAIDNLYRDRLRTLQSVDDNVEAIFEKLSDLGILNNTYVIYTADNGFHLGEYRLAYGKREPYETDVRVPFFIRGPGIDANITVTINANNIDIAPTIADLAGVDIPHFVDGKSIVPFVKTKKDPDTFRAEVLLEHWGLASDSDPFTNNTWQGLRILNSTTNSLYTSWCTSQNEVYDLSADAYELKNLFDTSLPDLDFLDSTLRAYFQCGNVSCQSIAANVNPYRSTPLTPCFNHD